MVIQVEDLTRGDNMEDYKLQDSSTEDLQDILEHTIEELEYQAIEEELYYKN